MSSTPPDHMARLAAGQACFEAALQDYLPRGLAVLCCCDPHHVGVGREHARTCDTPGKVPIHAWKAWQTTLPTPETLQRLWHDYPIGNVGCVLGQVSGLVRVDVDGPEGEALLAAWSAGDLPPTWTFRSSAQGRGLLYGWPRDVPCRTTTQASPGEHRELRLMANGSQTILPPSRHASGSRYTWEPGCSPAELPLAPAPAWLRARLIVMPSTHDARPAPPADADRITRALARLPNTDLGYDIWLHIGMALHSTEAPWARALWETWSQQSSKYNPAKQEKAWQSFTPDGGITLDRLYALAGQAHVNGRIPDLSSAGPPGAPPPAPEADEDDRRPLPYSDYTNALAFVRDWQAQVRYCFPWKSWLVWSGTHWQRDETGLVAQYAKRTVKRLARQLDLLDDERAKALMAHIKKSLSKASLDALVRTAQDEPGIPVKPDVLDADPWALNCTNGTLDLQTGVLQPHAQEAFLTKCLPYPYDPEAVCPTWEAFLWRIMGGSQGPDTPEMSTAELAARDAADIQARSLIAFLQRIVGYTLTGSTREQCLFILHGPTKTGKSTFLATLRALLGAYGQQADMDSFLHRDRPEVRNDLADLAGSRFVCALESQEGRRLAEALVKQLTGGTDLIKARFLFQEYFSYKPQFKLYLGTNHKPVIRDTDSAIWERIRLVPFVAPIPPAERDKTLDLQLQRELPGILAWAVRGCLAWQACGGLAEPEAVVQATAGYRSEMDSLGRFLEECCLIDQQVRVRANTLYERYQRWCGETGEQALTLTAMGKQLEDQGFTRYKSNGIWRLGLGLLDPAPEP